jgi:hypothetical protein
VTEDPDMAINSYRNFTVVRVAVSAGAWNAITIPAGSLEAMISLEDSTTTFLINSVNTTNPASEGAFVPASGAYNFPGVAGQAFTVYVSPSANTTALVQTQS